MNTTQYREILKGLYKSKRWAEKVTAMTEEQVVAIVLRLKAQGLLKF